MGKMDLPKGYKTFDKMFDRMALKHSHGSLFDDFLTYSIFCLNSTRNQEDLKYYSDKFSDQEMIELDKMFKEMILTINDRIEEHGYFDFPGHYYEYIAHGSRKKGFGQFFTPEHLVSMMVKMQDAKPGVMKKVNDPACGSGRMLLGFHAEYPGNLLYAEDLDYTCCLMTVWNMLIGGGVGEVVHHDSLLPDTYYKGWRINQHLNTMHIMSVEIIPKEQSYVWTMWDQRKQANKSEYDEGVKARKEAQKSTQMSLF